MPDPAYYVLWIDNATRRGGSSLKWSLPFATAREAREWAKGKVDDGEASLAAVWAFDGPAPGRLRPQEVYPAGAQKVIAHYREMEGLAAQGPPRATKGA